METFYHHLVSSKSAPRLFTVLILASMLFSVLPAFAPAGASAQDGSETTQSAEIQENAEPTPSPETQEGSETPPPEPTATAEPQPSGVAAYLAEARICPPGFDPSSGDASTALANCIAPLAGSAVTLGSQNPNYPGDTRTTGGDGVAAWPDIPLGTGYSVTQAVPQGHADPWVYCEVTGGPGADQYLFFKATGGFMDIGLSNPNLANYAQAYCRWFDVQSGDPALALTPDANAAAAEVHLTNYLCPVNYNTADMTLGALKAACTTMAEGISFSLTASTGGPQTDSTDPQGVLTWTNVAPGQVTIAESIPEGIRFAQPYCSVAPVGSGAGSPNLSLVQSDGKTISGQVAPGQALHCELFNVPVPQSTVAVIPFLCPSDYDTADMTLQALTRGCSIPGLNIEFTVTTVEGEQLTGTTGTNGFLEWKDLTSGTVKIEQTAPEGYLAGPTYCDPAPPAGELDGSSWQSPTYEDDAVSFDIPDRYTLNCVSFYVEGVAPTVVAAETGTGSVLMQGYVCADELYDAGKSLQNYLDLCPTPHDGASVRLFSAESGADLTAQFAGSAQISFPDVPPGEAELNLLGGSSESRLFCTTYPRGDAAPPISAYTESSVIANIEGDSETSCYWFNFQELPDDAYVTITINKYLCGPEYPDTTAIEDWRAACPDPNAGVTFNAEHVGGPTATGTTSDEGVVTLKVLPGDIYIYADQPYASANGYAWCGAGAPGATPTYVNSGRLSAGEYGMPLSDIDPSLVYSCDWITVPLEFTSEMTDGAGNLVVLKWRCPEGYDAAGKSIEQLREACSTPQANVPIAVYYETGTPYVERTQLEKGPAIARFEALNPGKVSISEYDASGKELQRVICSTSDIGKAGFGVIIGYMEYQVTDGSVAATIEAGKELSCHFFNVPAKAHNDGPPKAGMVIMDARICPPGFAALNSSYVDIAMYCASEPGVEFKITQGETELSAVTYASGVATFSDVPFGVFRISEYPREGHDPPKVFCRFTLVGEGSTGNLDPVAVDNWGVPSELKDGYFMECVWASMPAAATSTDPSSVTLHTYVCPEETGEYESIETLLDTCTGGPEGIAFTVSLPLDLAPKMGTTDASGTVTFSNVSPDFNTVDETGGQGYKPLAAWCTYGSVSGSSEVARYSAQPLYLYVAGGNSIECSWFSMPYIEPAQVDITMRLCPADFNPVDATNDRILAECLEKPAGIDFRVENGSTLSPDPAPVTYEATLATSENGIVSFDDVAGIPLRISERSQSYRSVAVNCGLAAKDESPSSYTSLSLVEDGVAYEAEPYTVVTCYWAMIQPPPATLGIHLNTCPPSVAFDADPLEELMQSCTPQDGADLRVTVEDAAYDKTVKTDSAGLADFGPLPAGQLVMSNDSPNLQTVRVFCGTATSGYSNMDFAAGSVEYIAGSDEDVVCYWFASEETQTVVTVHTYGCQVGHVAQGSSFKDALEQCPSPLKGVTFTLGGPATELSRDTDAAGNVTWDALAPGPIFISETPPHGYTNAVVFCAVYYEEALFESVPVEQLAIELEVGLGDTVECYWFNYAHPSQPNTPTPIPSPIPVSTPTPGNSTPTPEPDAPATLVLTNHVCPEEYDVYAADADLTKDCDEVTPGIEVSLADLGEDETTILPVEIATTDEDGVVVFSGVEPGLWLLTESLPETTETAFIASCTSDQRDLEKDPLFTPLTYLGPDGQIGIVLVPGETLTCDAYTIPEEDAAA